MPAPNLPRAQTNIAQRPAVTGKPTGMEPIEPVWYNFLKGVLDFINASGLVDGDVIAGINARIAALEDAEGGTIVGPVSVQVLGSLGGGGVTIRLLNDVTAPGNTYYYGTGPTGGKGWHTVASAFTATADGILLTTGADGVTDITPDDDLAAVEAIATTGLAARTAADTWTTRTVTAGTGISVADGDGVAGNPTVSHADTSSVANLTSDNSGTVVIQDVTVTFDTFGHVQTATVGTVDVAAALAGTFQPLDATLTALSGQNWAANAIPIGSGVDTVAQVSFAANTFPARASTGNLVAKAVTDNALALLTDATVPRIGIANTWTASPQSFAPAAASVEVQMNVASTFTADLAWMRGGVRRWQFRLNTTAESGSNAGSNLDIRNYTDAGVAALAARWNRATGVLDFAVTPTVASVSLAIITASITNGDTTHSPSGDAVFDALAGKETAGAAAAALAAANTYTDDEIATREPTIAAGTTAQLWRGDKAWTNWLDGDYRFGTSSGLFGSGREVVISAGTSGDNIAHLSLQGSRTTNGTFGTLNYYHQSDRVAGMAAFRDAADDAGAFAWSVKPTGGAIANALRIMSDGTVMVGAAAASNGGGILQVGGNAVPYTDNTSTLGAAALRWSATYTHQLFTHGKVLNKGIISPAQITANQNDYAPTGYADCYIFRLNSDAARSITGLQGGEDGREVIIMNIGAFSILLSHDTTSTAANRWLCPNNTSATIRQNGWVKAIYDSTSSRWRVMGA